MQEKSEIWDEITRFFFILFPKSVVFVLLSGIFCKFCTNYSVEFAYVKKKQYLCTQILREQRIMANELQGMDIE